MSYKSHFKPFFKNFIETNSNAILGVMEGQNDQELNEGTHKIKKISHYTTL